MPRRLLLLLAALTALALTSAASALAASGTQNRTRASTGVTPTLIRAGAVESSCTHQGSVVSAAGIVAGFCVAAEDTLQLPADFRPIAGGAPMLGEGGVQVTSRTLLRDTGQGFRVDVENPAPGVRPGQLHLQSGGDKYLYDFESNQFEGLPPGLARQVAGDPNVASAIAKARDYLNVQ